MPRSTVRKPNPSLDLSPYLYVLRDRELPEHVEVRLTGQDFPPPPETVTSQTLFGNDHPLEVEIGSGKGLFLTTESQRRPNHNYLGIEIVGKYARHSAARLAKAGRDNAKMVSGNGESLLANRVPESSLEAVHVYFPDPWWKKRHRKRRVVNESSVRDFSKAVRTGGRLHFWTDVLDYFEATIEMIADVAPEFGVPMPEAVRESAHDLDYHTHFERRSRQNEIPVYRVCYARR
ncbi:MAG: tRNA (guanosine(46)-N7)-methyltransferase TrmB [Planctomycetota bacterium]